MRMQKSAWVDHDRGADWPNARERGGHAGPRFRRRRIPKERHSRSGCPLVVQGSHSFRSGSDARIVLSSSSASMWPASPPSGGSSGSPRCHTIERQVKLVTVACASNLRLAAVDSGVSVENAKSVSPVTQAARGAAGRFGGRSRCGTLTLSDTLNSTAVWLKEIRSFK